MIIQGDAITELAERSVTAVVYQPGLGI